MVDVNTGRLPTLAIVGYGRAGKDTAGSFLTEHFRLKFSGGCSWAIRHYMAERLSADAGRIISPDEAYINRHDDRLKWYNYCNEYRKDDPAKLVRLVLETSDFVCGIRDRKEIISAKNEGLLDLIIWIENYRAEADKTVTFSKEDCDIVVLNNSSLADYYERLYRLGVALGIPKIADK